MKKLHIVSRVLFIIMLLAVAVWGATAQTTPEKKLTKKEREAQKAALIKKLVEEQNYVFVAQTVLPMGGRSRQVTPDFDLRVAKDSILSWLPYFGRAFSAPIDATRSPLQFKTKDFEYTTTPGKKGGWDIVIKPKDVSDIQSMNMSITESGYAYLTVQSINRQPISFNGYIIERKDPKGRKKP